MTSRRPRNLALLAGLSLVLAACSSAGPVKSAKDSKAPISDSKTVAASTGSPYPSTYKPATSTPTLIRGATVLIGNGQRLENADVLLRDGLIAAVGKQLDAPADARIVDGQGKWVTPGLIDVHSHLGVYPSPGVDAHSDGNEATAPTTAATPGSTAPRSPATRCVRRVTVRACRRSRTGR